MDTEKSLMLLKALLCDDYGVSAETYNLLCGLFGEDKACAGLLSLVETGEQDRCFLPPDYVAEATVIEVANAARGRK